MKVLRVIARLNIGGPAIHAVLLTRELNRDRFESRLVCGNISDDEGDMSYFAARNQVNPYFIPELKRELNIFRDLVALKKIYYIIKSQQPDIVHTHTAKAGTLGRIAAILYNLLNRKRAKLIHTFHGHVFEGYFSRFKSGVFLSIERFLAIFTSRIITVSESVKKQIVSFGICREEKIKVIPLGFELYELLKVPPRSATAINIGIIGRLVPIKNHRLFIEAAAKLIQAEPTIDLGFMIVGDGELRQSLEEYSRQLNIARYIKFYGWQRDIIRVYSDIDIVVLTSLNEGTPASLIEAMAAGRAVVATDVGGVGDLLGDKTGVRLPDNTGFEARERGIIVKQGDSGAFAAAMEFLVKDRELRMGMGLAGREFSQAKFNLERLVKDMENLYNMV